MNFIRLTQTNGDSTLVNFDMVTDFYYHQGDKHTTISLGYSMEEGTTCGCLYVRETVDGILMRLGLEAERRPDLEKERPAFNERKKL